MATTLTATTLTATSGATTGSTTSYDLESGAYAGMPSLVGTAMGPARSWFSGALEWVCGEPDTLTSTGQQYAELGQRLRELSGSLTTAADGLPSWQGPAATRFHATVTESVDVLDAVGGFVGHTDQILRAAAEVAVKAADAIWDLVTELVRWLCTTLVKALAASTVSMGSSIAAWLSSAVAQVGRVVGVVTQLCGKVGAILTKIMGLLQKLAALITRYKDLLAGIQQVLTTVKEFSDRFGEVSDGVPGQGPSWQAYRDADPTERARLLAPTTTDPSATVPSGSSPLAANGGRPWAPGFTQTGGAGSFPTPGSGYVATPPAGVAPVAASLSDATGPDATGPDAGGVPGRPVTDRTIDGAGEPQPYRPTVDGTQVAGADPMIPPTGYRPDVTGGSTPPSAGGYTPPSGGVGGGGWAPPSGGSSGGGWTAPSGGGLGTGVPRPGSIDPVSPGMPGAGSTPVGGPGPRFGSGAAGMDPTMTPFVPLSPQQRAASGSGVPLTERDEAWSESVTDREAAQAMGTRAAGIDPPVGGGGVGGVGPMSGAAVAGLPQAPAGSGGPTAPPTVDPLPRVNGSSALPPSGTGSGAAMAPPPLTPGRRDDRTATGAAKPVSDRTTDLIDLVEGDRTEEPRHD